MVKNSPYETSWPGEGPINCWPAVYFAAELKKLFTESYPSEPLTSAILLQHFSTGLSPLFAASCYLKVNHIHLMKLSSRQMMLSMLFHLSLPRKRYIMSMQPSKNYHNSHRNEVVSWK